VLLTKISNGKNADFRSSTSKRHQHSKPRLQCVEPVFLDLITNHSFQSELQLSSQVSLPPIQTQSESFHEEYGPPASKISALYSANVSVVPDRGFAYKEANCPAIPQGLSMDPSPPQILQSHNGLLFLTKRQRKFSPPPAKARDRPHELAGTGLLRVFLDEGPKRPPPSDRIPPAPAPSAAAADDEGQGQAVGLGGVSNRSVFAAGASAFRRVGPRADRGVAVAFPAAVVGAGDCWGGL
jgi:hypothetical protein